MTDLQKDLVPNEQSLELKALGFDKPCFAMYDEKGTVGFITYTNSKEDIWNCAAPTFSQAFRWFREKYELTSEVCVEQYRRKTNKKWMFSITYLNEDAMYEHSKTTFENYEEAELACLNKLIKIVESKKE